MIFLIFPTQLFSDISHLKNNTIYLIEEPRYFTDFKFHKLKLVYHRASMKKYYNMLKKKHYKVHYVEFHEVNNTFYKSLDMKDTISSFYPEDFKLQKKLESIFDKNITFIDSPNFLIKRSELSDITKLIKKSGYNFVAFYKYMRTKLNILLDSNKKPIGGKWSYDKENRNSLPDDIKVPQLTTIRSNKHIVEARNYVEKHFPNNYGIIDHMIYPIDSKSSKKWLDKFIKERLGEFGPYEDAVSTEEPFVFHSVLSPMMNIGLLTDMEVVSISYEYYNKHMKSISIQSFEGFIRQVIGWRNYVYTLYLLEGDEMRKSNELKHTNKLNFKKFWEGTTGILPIDNIIEKIQKYAYVHHIERLMYLGNFMLLCMIDPDDVYRIFMEWTIDSYDWVMVANVYGMSQAASNIMMTRPYFASSNYILRMSNYKKDDSDWDKIWDSLYYNFIDRHYNILKKNYATATQAKHWNNKSPNEKKEIKKIAKEYLDSIVK